MSDDGVAFDPQWTPAARAQIELAGRDLIDAVEAHLALLAAATATTPVAEIQQADAALRCAAAEYAAAQFDLTGGFGPLAELESWDAGRDEEPSAEPVAYVTVLQRADYAVVDEAAVLAAGRAASRRTRRRGPEGDAAVTSVGAALSEWARREGWESLAELPGLSRIGAIAHVVELEEAPTVQEALAEEAPADPFTVSGGLLFTAVDPYS